MPGGRMQAVLEAIDRINAGDPVRESDPAGGEPVPRALLYGRRMSARLQALEPDADELVRIAVRAQHIRRWAIPREDYPEGRQGYHRWRRDLGRYHAKLAGRIMAEYGYDDESVARVGRLLRKEGLATDSGTRLLEDVAALVFIEHYLAGFAASNRHRYTEERLTEILRRTWRKMSARGRRAALELPLDPELRRLVLAAAGDR